MKFKKSHILLISLMSLFLLLGMSAVSAASDVDNLAQDLFIDDVSEIGDIDNVDNDIIDANVLSEGDPEAGGDGNTNPDDPGTGENGGESESTPTTIEANDKEYAYGDNITFNITVKANDDKININPENLIVSYRNQNDENFTDMNFTLYNESGEYIIKFKFSPRKTLDVGNYIVKIQFVNSTIDGKNYTESEKIVNLNIRKSDTIIHANDVKINIGQNLIFPLNITIESNKILNVSYLNMSVDVFNQTGDFIRTFSVCYNETSGIWILTGIKVWNFNLTEPGDYILQINFKGTNNSNPSSKNITLHLLANNTIIFNGNVSVDHETQNITIPINVTSYGTNLELNSEDMVLELVYYNGTENLTKIITNETFALELAEDGGYILSFINEVPLNNAKLTIFYANNTLNETNKTITFIEKNTIISNGIIVVNDSGNVTIPISVNHTSIIIFDGKNITNTTVLNFTNEELMGNLTLNLTYYNGNENLTIPISSDKYQLNGENGTYNISFNFYDLISDESISCDNATVNLILYGNDKLNKTNKTVTLRELIKAYIVPVNTTLDYQSGEFVFLLLANKTGDPSTDNPLINTTITIDGFYIGSLLGPSIYMKISDTFTSNETGYIVIQNKNFVRKSQGLLSAGDYNITFLGTGFIFLNQTESITVNNASAKIIADNLVYDYGKNLTYTFQLVNTVTNEPIIFSKIQIIFNGSNINPKKITINGTTDSNGTYTLPSWALPGGLFDLTIKSLNGNLICSNVKKTITVKPLNAILTAYNRTIYYNSDYSTVVRLNDKKTGKAVANAYVLIRVYISSSKYADFYGKTNKDGKVYLTTPLNVGKHKIIYQIADSSYTASKITRYLTVKKASAKFTASNVTTYYRSGKYYQIKLTNSKNKKAVYYAKMNIKVYISKNRYYNYTGTTDANGLVKFKISYKPGTYKVVISSVDKGYSASAITRQIKVSKAPINITPVSLKVKKGSYFKVKVISTKTKKALSSVYVKVRVYTGRTYKTYSIKTNSQGIASLKIGQSVGKHKVVLSPKSTSLYSAKTVTRTLTVTR